MAGLLLLSALAGCATQGGPPPATAKAEASSSTHRAAAQGSHVKPYPFKNPLTATVLGTPDRLKAELPKKANLSIRRLKPLVDRKTPPTLRYARPLKYMLAAQNHPAPLAFVIAGTGDSALSSKCVLLSRALYQVGYSVACLPSPTSVTFMLGAAKYPVPGRMKTDVADLYRMMQAVRDDVSGDIDITGYSLTGWSLGATEAAFVAHLDQKRQVFHFQHVLLLNPAVSLWASVGRMDNLLQRNLPGGFDALPRFLAQVLGNIQQSEGHGKPLRFNEDALYQAYEKGAFDKKDIGAIVGLAFRLSLANMAFAADVLTHSDVIVPKNVNLGPYASLGVYFRRSFRMSFSNYINQLLVPYWNRDGRHVSKAQLIAEGDMHRIAPFLANDDHIEVFTNADDPILNADEVQFLRHTFKGRARIRPHGGHLGNLSYKKTIHALQDYFTQ
ncbi:alpha/beta hydrolase [Salinisphaera sp. RV14]|uniref:alpha/beta hydrolase n=1 Tax=unclassified Salinisphaera TaxID=2649847 RepID=UPI003F84215F